MKEGTGRAYMRIILAISGASGAIYGIRLLQNLADFVYDETEQGALIASGSFKTAGMIIAPCSMKTLAGIANGYADGLLIRAADVCLKEKRPLVLLVRETPLHAVHLENMLKLSRMGVTIMPPVPAFYTRPEGLEEMIAHTAGRVLEQFGLDMPGFTGWGGVLNNRRKPDVQVLPKERAENEKPEIYETGLFVGQREIKAIAIPLGDDLCVAIFGGDVPHLGAVALAVSRKSLAEPGETGSSTSILTLTGHKEDVIVREVSSFLSSKLRKNVAVCCGIHLNNASSEQIAAIISGIEKLKIELLRHYQLKEPMKT